MIVLVEVEGSRVNIYFADSMYVLASMVSYMAWSTRLILGRKRSLVCLLVMSMYSAPPFPQNCLIGIVDDDRLEGKVEFSLGEG